MSTKRIPTFGRHSLGAACLFGPPGKGLRLMPLRVSPAGNNGCSNKAGGKSIRRVRLLLLLIPGPYPSDM